MVAFNGRKIYAKTQFSGPYCVAWILNPDIIIKDACMLTRLPRK